MGHQLKGALLMLLRFPMRCLYVLHSRSSYRHGKQGRKRAYRKPLLPFYEAGGLPLCLQEDIVGRLPLSDRIRCRVVCKLWSFHDFAASCIHLYHPTPCCLGWKGDSCILYEPCCRHSWVLSPPPPLSACRLCTADKGLLCYSSHSPHTYVVWNPMITRFCSLTPPTCMSPGRPLLQQIVVLENSFIVLQVDKCKGTWIFDSITGFWESAESMPLSQTDARESRFHTVPCEGKVFALGYLGFQVFEFNLETRVWVQRAMNSRSIHVLNLDYCTTKLLLECNGNIYMACLNFPNIIHSLVIWRFEHGWVEFGRVPKDFFAHLQDRRDTIFSLYGTKDIIIVTAKLPPFKAGHILTFDIRVGNWQCMVPAVTVSLGHSAVSYYPNLSALP